MHLERSTIKQEHSTPHCLLIFPPNLLAKWPKTGSGSGQVLEFSGHLRRNCPKAAAADLDPREPIYPCKGWPSVFSWRLLFYYKLIRLIFSRCPCCKTSPMLICLIINRNKDHTLLLVHKLCKQLLLCHNRDAIFSQWKNTKVTEAISWQQYSYTGSTS